VRRSIPESAGMAGTHLSGEEGLHDWCGSARMKKANASRIEDTNESGANQPFALTPQGDRLRLPPTLSGKTRDSSRHSPRLNA
jgi:hypothetical protein